MPRLFLDSGVLMAAVRGEPDLRDAARRLLTRSENEFLTSGFVYLETAAKALYNQRELELRSYEAFFARAHWERDANRILALGTELAALEGLGPVDALHVAAAFLLRADVLVTVERPGKSIYRARLVPVAFLTTVVDR